MWLFYTLLAALAVGLTDIARKAMFNELPFLPTVTALQWASVIVLGGFFIRTLRRETKAGRKLFPNRLAWRGFVAAALLDTCMLLMYLLALKWGPISVVAPLRHTVPLFSLLIGYRVLRERTGLWQKAGIVLSVASLALLVWSINDGTSGTTTLSPYVIGALLLALGVAIMSAGALVANKYATAKQYGNMNAIAFVTLDHLLAAVVYTVIVFERGDIFTPELYRPDSALLYFVLGTGVLSALASWALITACSVGDTVRVSPVARLSVLVSVIAGGAWFMEENLGLRIAATVLFLVGLLPVIMWQEKVKKENISVEN